MVNKQPQKVEKDNVEYTAIDNIPYSLVFWAKLFVGCAEFVAINLIYARFMLTKNYQEWSEPES